MRNLRLLLALLALASGAGFGTVASASAAITETDKAFVRELPIHHVMAIEMGKLAVQEADHKAIFTLGRNIVKAQRRETTRLRALALRLDVAPPAAHDHEEMMRDLEILGVTSRQAGMNMTMDDLYGAEPFDRAFIDKMIPHHQGAIRMARAELRAGKVRALRKIAKAIVTTQSREIRLMNKWRKAWFGRPSPAGGVPEG
ncbi:MAG: DUF305 domain-containing protein [Solirubrobacterales bacterium]